MTREQVIRMAREAGLQDEFGVSEFAYTDRLEHFASLVAAAEREACAELCELWNATSGERLAAAIRARGNN